MIGPLPHDRACGRPRPLKSTLRRRHHRRRRPRAGHRLLPGQARRHRRRRPRAGATSAAAPAAATPPSSARTTARPRASPSTTRPSSSTRASRRELGYNVLFSQQGHLTLAHTDSRHQRACGSAPRRTSSAASTAASSTATRSRGWCRRSTSRTARATRSWPRSTTRPAASSATTRSSGATRAAPTGSGVDIHPAHRGHRHRRGRRARDGRRTTAAATIETGTVVNATAGWALDDRDDGRPPAADRHPPAPGAGDRAAQAVPGPGDRLRRRCTSTSARPTAASCVIGAEIDPYTSYSHRSTLPFLEDVRAPLAGAVPVPRGVKVLRQWAGICDMTPDFSPIMGAVPGIEGFVLDVGWGTYGFKAGPVAGKRIAELIATGRTPDAHQALRPRRASRRPPGRREGRRRRLALTSERRRPTPPPPVGGGGGAGGVGGRC